MRRNSVKAALGTAAMISDPHHQVQVGATRGRPAFDGGIGGPTPQDGRPRGDPERGTHHDLRHEPGQLVPEEVVHVALPSATSNNRPRSCATPTARNAIPASAVRWRPRRSAPASAAGERPAASRRCASQWSQPATANGMATSSGPTTSSRRSTDPVAPPRTSPVPMTNRPSSAIAVATETATNPSVKRMTPPKYAARSALDRSSSPMIAASRIARPASEAWNQNRTAPDHDPGKRCGQLAQPRLAAIAEVRAGPRARTRSPGGPGWRRRPGAPCPRMSTHTGGTG